MGVMKNMLVTGGAGFIGSNFVRYTLDNHSEYRVTVLDKLTYAGNINNLSDRAGQFDFVEGDICDKDLVDSLVQQCDIVVHFAAESHNDNSLRNPMIFVQTNLVGTTTLLEAVRRFNKRFHHVSTDEVFGDLALDSDDQFTENSAMNPSTPYSATKAGSDMLVKAWIKSFGIQATMSNCSNNFGPYQHIEKYIPRVITSVIAGYRPKLHSQGEGVRDWLHVDDHSRAVHMIIERGRVGELYLIGGGHEQNNKYIMETLLQLMGQPKDAFDYTSDRPANDRRYSIDTSKIQRELGWRPKRTELLSELNEIIDWYRSNQAWWQGEKASIEAAYAVEGR